jgi:ABC-type multidrug transport system fused ATPase/permease subunit
VIKVNRGEEAILEHARSIGADLYGSFVREADSRSLARFLMEATAGVGLIAVLALGGRDVAAGTLQWQSLLSLLVAVMAVYGPVVGLLGVYNSIQNLLPNLDRIGAVMREASEVPDAPNAQPLEKPPSTIELQDLSFAYDDETVLDSISATLHQGEKVGIVGHSGAGKSTLVALMLRLYDPTRGRIFCDGVDLRQIRHADLMDKCAIVLQEPFLFIDTVANNIRFARPDASMEDVVAAAKAANIHEEIMLMERGYDTVIGRSVEGRGISVGQKQRIAIAAALLKDAPILFLDEATSSLDSVSERAVQEAMDRLMDGRTTFVIAHRLSTLRNVDRILVLERGKLVGIGTHEELLESCPAYRQPWVHQNVGSASPWSSVHD